MNHTDHYNTWPSYPKDQSCVAESDAWLAKHGNGMVRLEKERNKQTRSKTLTQVQRTSKNKKPPTKLTKRVTKQ